MTNPPYTRFDYRVVSQFELMRCGKRRSKYTDLVSRLTHGAGSPISEPLPQNLKLKPARERRMAKHWIQQPQRTAVRRLSQGGALCARIPYLPVSHWRTFRFSQTAIMLSELLAWRPSTSLEQRSALQNLPATCPRRTSG